MTPKFSAREAVKYSWNKVMENPGKFMALGFLILLVQFGPIFLMKIPVMGGPLRILGMVLQYWMQMGMIMIALKVFDSKPFQVMDIFPMNLELFLRYIGCMILYFLIVMGGMLLLIVPGVIWAYKYMLAPTLVLDKNMKVMDAIKLSGRISDGSKWKLFCLMILIVGVNILGALCLLVGMTLTIPMSGLAMVYAYRKLADTSRQDQTIPIPPYNSATTLPG